LPKKRDEQSEPHSTSTSFSRSNMFHLILPLILDTFVSTGH
jgi:hypothetical protein